MKPLSIIGLDFCMDTAPFYPEGWSALLFISGRIEECKKDHKKTNSVVTVVFLLKVLRENKVW